MFFGKIVIATLKSQWRVKKNQWVPFVCKPKEIKNKLCELIFQFNDSSLADTVLSCKELKHRS